MALDFLTLLPPGRLKGNKPKSGQTLARRCILGLAHGTGQQTKGPSVLSGAALIHLLDQ